MAIQTTTFKGARYIVKFHDPIEWVSTESYEAIEAVKHNAYTYISKQPVPAGVQIDNDDFWLLWADPNAQMEQLRQLVASYVDDVTALDTLVDTINDALPIADFNSVNTVAKAIEDEATARQAADDAINEIIGHAKSEAVSFVDSGYYNNSVYKCVKIAKSAIKAMRIISQDTILSNDSYNELLKLEPHDFSFNGPLGKMIVSNGHVIYNTDDGESNHWYIVAIDEDLNVTVIKDVMEQITGDDLLNDGYYWAFRIWSPVIVNGSKFDWETQIPESQAIDIENKEYIFQLIHSRMMLGYDADNFYLIWIEGQIPGSVGADFDDMYDICYKLGLQNVVNMDGGGSTQAWTVSPMMNLVVQNKRNTADIWHTRAVPMIAIDFN